MLFLCWRLYRLSLTFFGSSKNLVGISLQSGSIIHHIPIVNGFIIFVLRLIGLPRIDQIIEING